MATTAPQQKAYIIRISLDGIDPPIWRRSCVPWDITLDRLHDVIQIVMGWEERHLHSFTINGKRYTEAPENVEVDGLEEGHYRLRDLVKRAKTKFAYQYDFGDDWQHTVLVEQSRDVPKDHGVCVACLAGGRQRPPEDVGGIRGYEEFLRALSDPEHPERENYLTWCGGRFDPEAFDLAAVNMELAQYARWSRPRHIPQELTAGGGA